MFNLFKKKCNSYLGIDIGTTGIRVVQLGKTEEGIKLENYAYLETKEYLEILGKQDDFNDIKMSNNKIVADLRSIILEADINTNEVIMSIPTSSAFSSTIILPDIPESEIAKAVDFEARRYIPIPLDEVVFDWSVIKKKQKVKKNKIDDSLENEILLVAISRETTSKYVNIVKALGLELVSLETEPFSLARCLVGQEEGVFEIVDMGNKTTSITIIEDGAVSGSHNISGTGGEEITKMISRGFNVDLNRAEKLKIDFSSNKNKDLENKMFDIILPMTNVIASELKRVNDLHLADNKKKVKKIILTGGTIGIPRLIEHLSKELEIPVEIGNPWKDVIYNTSLSDKLEKNAPFFSIAVGLALRGFEK
ncbi:MAG: type IV pilus assembly protein PilM [Candidatus Pacebacteria bacterium]|nr:type IV pilus assembly protein PilM [Candidatus Paceibacterota bacterium]